MKPLLPYLLIAVAGLGLCGWLVLRHAVRNNCGGVPALCVRDSATGRPRGGNPKAKQRSEARLRREERRQKPWEGRN